MDEPVAYTVSATCPDEPTRARFIAWLVDHHVEDVEKAARIHATRIVRVDGELRVEVRYTFPSRAALETYLKDHAPALRAEGLKHFGPDSGVVFARSTGVIFRNAHEIPF